MADLWCWQERVKNNIPCKILPAAVPCLRRLLASLSLLLILCKVTAVTVVGLVGAVVGAVIVRRSHNALIWGDVTYRRSGCVQSHATTLVVIKSL